MLFREERAAQPHRQRLTPSRGKAAARMTTLQDDLTDVHPGRAKIEIALALALTVPGFVVRFPHPDISHPVEAFLFGLAIVGAAFHVPVGRRGRGSRRHLRCAWRSRSSL